MMKGLILLANYFEDVEALITIDMLRRAKIEIDLVSITEDYNLITQSGVKLQADYLIDEIDRSMHPIMSQKIFEYYFSQLSNANNTQLIKFKYY